jgi:zinc finger BED domain-containing protein 1 (E3 SUMO-protein ligase ZBED1)
MPEELSLYLNSPNEKIQQNPLAFWKMMKDTYPTIFEVVFKYVPVIATSVPSERLFSQAGLILNSLRNRLSEDLAEKLLFLHEIDDKFWEI